MAPKGSYGGDITLTQPSVHHQIHCRDSFSTMIDDLVGSAVRCPQFVPCYYSGQYKFICPAPKSMKVRHSLRSAVHLCCCWV